MEVKAKLNYLRIAPRKMRLLADLIRSKKVSEARAFLDFTLKKGAHPLKKLLESAVANAKNDFQLAEDTLSVAKITVDGGPMLKRWRARARGRAAQIQKKTSHITLILEGEKRKIKKPAPVPSAGRASTGKKVPKAAEKKAEQATEESKETKSKAERKVPKLKKEIASAVKRDRKVFKRIFRRKSF